LYALHRDAAIGTIISVTNPMSNRTVYAKVIARVPDGYERNVEVILSPEAARKIGALDPKFFVKVKYFKK
jgi:rare lipoprotein A (peptidoglycan hydrolase)